MSRRKGRKGARRAVRAAPARKHAAAKRVRPIPKGFHTVTPGLVFQDASAAIDFYKKALGAKEIMRMPGPSGKGIMHAELKIGDSIVFLNEEMPHGSTLAPTADRPASCSFFVYVADCDAVLRRAVKAGARVTMPLDMFWGDYHLAPYRDRIRTVVDPFGVTWGIATHLKDMTAGEMARASEEAMDDEHRLQASLLDELERLLREEEDREPATRVLDRLLDLTRVHFLAEEQLMCFHAYPEYKRHVAEHANRAEQLAEAREALVGGELPVTAELMAALRGWLEGHIAIWDAALLAYLRSAGTVR